MSSVGDKERRSQERAVAFFADKDCLNYDYLGNWTERLGNDNVDEDLLRAWLSKQGHDERIIDKTLRELGSGTNAIGQ